MVEGPIRAALAQGVQSLLGLPVGRVTIHDVQDISPRISTSRVFRVGIRALDNDVPDSLILKIPDWEGESLLDSHDPWLPRREQTFFESALPARLPPGLRTPDVLRTEQQAGRTCIWMEDLASSLERVWCPDDVIEAARRSALLHGAYRHEGETLAEVDWLEREGYAAYAHHIPRAHENLDRIRAHPTSSSLFSPDEISQLHHVLNASVGALAELRRFPITLVHGDFHIRNLGFDPHGDLVCVDWAHVGLAPLGSDIAVLASLYYAFGGTGGQDAIDLDREILAAYVQEVEHLTGERPLFGAVSRAFALWHVTWGLHLRLGPGLSYLLEIGSSHDVEVNRVAVDVREGCKRALIYLSEVRR